jgi:hypothetical protein
MHTQHWVVITLLPVTGKDVKRLVSRHMLEWEHHNVTSANGNQHMGYASCQVQAIARSQLASRLRTAVVSGHVARATSCTAQHVIFAEQRATPVLPTMYVVWETGFMPEENASQTQLHLLVVMAVMLVPFQNMRTNHWVVIILLLVMGKCV